MELNYSLFVQSLGPLWVRLLLLVSHPEHRPHRQFHQQAAETQHETGIKQSGQRRAGTHKMHLIPKETASFVCNPKRESPFHRKEPPTF